MVRCTTTFPERKEIPRRLSINNHVKRVLKRRLWCSPADRRDRQQAAACLIKIPAEKHSSELARASSHNPMRYRISSTLKDAWMVSLRACATCKTSSALVLGMFERGTLLHRLNMEKNSTYVKTGGKNKFLEHALKACRACLATSVSYPQYSSYRPRTLFTSLVGMPH